MVSRQWGVLLALVVIAVAASYYLQQTEVPGRFVGDAQSAIEIIGDTSSPTVEHGSADLTVVEFADYQCPACRSAHPALQKAIVQDGNVRISFKDWPILGERSIEAAKVALASQRQGIYPEVHDALMRAQRLDAGGLRKAVQAAGGSWEQVEADLARDEAAIADQLQANSQQAVSLGLRGTPGYLIGPFLVEGALSEEEFLKTFERGRSQERSKSSPRE